MYFLEQVPFACSKLSSSLQQICLLKQRHSVTRNGSFAATNMTHLGFKQDWKECEFLLCNWYLEFDLIYLLPIFHLIAHLLVLHPLKINFEVIQTQILETCFCIVCCCLVFLGFSLRNENYQKTTISQLLSKWLSPASAHFSRRVEITESIFTDSVTDFKRNCEKSY